MTYQLDKAVAQKLKDFFEPFDFIDKVVIFGSRAKHNANPKSDIDLCIYSLQMSDAQFSKLKIELEELPILYKIDIVHFEKSNEALRENVVRDGKLLFKKYSSIDEITINLDNLRKPINKFQRTKMKEGILYPYFGANGVVDYINTFAYNKKLLCIAEDGGAWGYKENCAYIIDEKCSVNNHAHVLEMIENKVDIDYLKYYLNITDLNFLITGTTRGKLTKTALNSIQIYLPSLTKQQQIAKTLDKAQELIDLRKAAIEKLDELAQSIFIDIFGDPVENPKGWDVDSVDTGCSEIVDCINRTAPLSENQTEYKMIRTTNIKNYTIIFNETRYVEKDVYDKWVRRLVPQKYDVVFTREAPVGEAGIITTDEKLFLGQRTMLFRPNQDRLSSYYLLYELMGNKVKAQIDKMSTGSTVKHLSVPDCKKFEINLPPIDLQNKFAQTIEKIESQKSLYEAELTQLQAAFDALMAQSFEG